MLLALLLGVPPRPTQGVAARRASDFLDSIGVNSAIDRRGEHLDKTIECANYIGVRWFRSGIEGGPSMDDLLELHRKTGARLSWSTGSGGTDLEGLIATGKLLAKAGALLAFEGSNEPNNWGVTWEGLTGGREKS